VELDGETLFLKKGMFGYRVVYPIRDKDGNFNWFNFLTGGSWGNLIKIGIIVGIILLLIYSYLSDLSSCRHLIECGARCPQLDTIKNLSIWN